MESLDKWPKQILQRVAEALGIYIILSINISAYIYKQSKG